MCLFSLTMNGIPRFDCGYICRKFYKLNGDRFFHTYGDALWDLYVLVTTANNPDVM